MTVKMVLTSDQLHELPMAARLDFVLGSFDALAPAEAMEIVAPHEPLPLRALLATKRTGKFKWSVVEKGPPSWRVRVERK
ncbi:MAG: DUF2249 domain-containing protein [Candidatus Thermoplasmatota archaeon]